MMPQKKFLALAIIIGVIGVIIGGITIFFSLGKVVTP
jgi:hypothetical protein